LAIADHLELPAEVVTARMAFVGQSGSGKTHGAMKLAECMLSVNAQIIVLDPVGPWWGLRTLADGNNPGFPIHVFGGGRGDVPLSAEGGALVADLVVSKSISAVLDVSDFTLSQMHRFVSEFAERFFEAKKRSPGAVHLFWEEAHTFMPQNLPPDVGASVMLNRVERIVRVGRNHGIGSTLISQSPQAVSKRCLNQVEVLFAMRMLGRHERKATSEWMGDNALGEGDLDLVRALPHLETGEAHLLSPQLLKLSKRVRILPKITFDSSRTPSFGDSPVVPQVLAPVDVEALQRAMEAIAVPVEERDVKTLRKRVAELQAQLAAKPSPSTPTTSPSSIDVSDPSAPSTPTSSESASETKEAKKTSRSKIRSKSKSKSRAKHSKRSKPTKRSKRSVRSKSANRSVRASRTKSARPRKRSSTSPVRGEIKRVEIPVVKPTQLAQLKRALKQASANISGLERMLSSVGEALHKLESDAASSAIAAPQRGLRAVSSPREARLPEAVVSVNAVKKVSPERPRRVEVAQGAREMLLTLGRHVPEPLGRERLAVLSVLSPYGGAFKSYLSRLRQAGWVRERKGKLSLTEAGLDMLGPLRPRLPRPSEEIVLSWMERLPKQAGSLLGALLASRGRSLSAEELARRAGIADVDVDPNANELLRSGIAALARNALLLERPSGKLAVNSCLLARS
jgi:hypothetical protein